MDMQQLKKIFDAIEKLKGNWRNIEFFFVLLEFSGVDVSDRKKYIRKIASELACVITDNTFYKKLLHVFPSWLAIAIRESAPDIERDYNARAREQSIQCILRFRNDDRILTR